MKTISMIEKLMSDPEKATDTMINQIINALAAEYENPDLAPDWAAIENMQDPERELAQTLQKIYKQMPLEFCYLLADLRDLKAGHIEKIQHRLIPDYAPLQMAASNDKVYEDEQRSSEEILSHIIDLLWYVDRWPPENDSDAYYHEEHSHQFRYMVAQIVNRIKTGNLNMSPDAIRATIEALEKELREIKEVAE